MQKEKLSTEVRAPINLSYSGKLEWHRLKRAGLDITQDNRNLVEVYCSYVDMFHKLQKFINSQKIEVMCKSDKGFVKHPAYVELCRAGAQIASTHRILFSRVKVKKPKLQNGVWDAPKGYPHLSDRRDGYNN